MVITTAEASMKTTRRHQIYKKKMKQNKTKLNKAKEFLLLLQTYKIQFLIHTITT